MASIRPGAKVKRNDPCPCGSGKKFKSCCMGKAGASELVAPPPDAGAGYRQLMAEAQANHQAGQLGKAADLYRQVLRRNPNEHVALAYLGQVMGQMGDIENAEWEAGEVLALLPRFSLETERKWAPYMNPGLDLYIEGLHKAGLPE